MVHVGHLKLHYRLTVIWLGISLTTKMETNVSNVSHFVWHAHQLHYAINVKRDLYFQMGFAWSLVEITHTSNELRYAHNSSMSQWPKLSWIKQLLSYPGCALSVPCWS
jgi:hypothetical protein